MLLILSITTMWSQPLSSLTWSTTIPHNMSHCFYFYLSWSSRNIAARQSSFTHNANCVHFLIKTSIAFCVIKIKPKVFIIPCNPFLSKYFSDFFYFCHLSPSNSHYQCLFLNSHMSCLDYCRSPISFLIYDVLLFLLYLQLTNQMIF